MKSKTVSELSWRTKLVPDQISFSWYLMGWCLWCMSRLSIWHSAKKKKTYSSLEGMLCFLWLFLFLFYTQCMYYLCFWDVHWFKRICSKRCYKRIHYPVYGSLSTINNHGNILTGHTRSIVLRSEKKRKALCLFVCATLDTVMYV